MKQDKFYKISCKINDTNMIYTDFDKHDFFDAVKTYRLLKRHDFCKDVKLSLVVVNEEEIKEDQMPE